MTDSGGNETEAASQFPAGVVMLRRVDVIDAELRVLLWGPARDFLAENTDRTLAPEVAAEVRTLIRTHDFTRRPIATGLAESDVALRVMRTVGPAGEFYTVFSERTLLRRQLAQIAYRFALAPDDAALLRLVAGGYPFAEMVNRTGIGAAALRSRLQALQEKAGCTERKELAALVFATSAAAPSVAQLNSPSPASSRDADSNTYRARRDDNRRR